MAFPEISTGYKPEFGLGALYQGFNAGNADSMAQEELIKKFLANQRSMQMDPLDAQTAQQNLDINDYKTAPEYKEAMTNTQIGQSMSSLTAGQNAQVLQPFKQRAERSELQNKATREGFQNQVYQIEDMLQTEPNPLVRMSLTKERDRLIGNLKTTPEFMQKRELRETGTDSAEYIAELRALQAKEAARLRIGMGTEKPLTAEQAMMKELARLEASGEITPEQAQEERAKIFSTKVAPKIQPGNIVNPNVAPGVLQSKPPPAAYAPPSKAGTTIKYDNQGNRIQ